LNLKKDIPNIFFYDLYLALKHENGFNLDLSHFESFLHAFTAGVWMEADDSNQNKIKKLKNLCRTLWVQRLELNSIFEYQFDLSIKNWFQREIDEKEEKGFSKNRKDAPEKKTNDSLSNDVEKDVTPEKDEKNKINDEKNNTSIDEEDAIDEDVDESQDFLDFYLEFNQGGGATIEIPEIKKEQEIPYIFSDEKYFPFEHRRVLQLWKKLKHSVMKVEGDRLDIKSTIVDFVREGYISKPRFYFENSGQINFYLFIEQGGPMQAYYKLSENLNRDLIESDKNNHIQRFFFTNYPIEVDIKGNGKKELAFFKNRNATEVITMSQLIKKIKPPSCIVFFSDAGALDNKMNSKRIDLSVSVLEKLKKQTNNILWINPVIDRKRWRGTSASYISLFCEMVPYTFKGLEGAIKKLKD